MELTWQLHPPVAVLAGASDGPSLTLHWLVHSRVKSKPDTALAEVTLDEVFGGLLN